MMGIPVLGILDYGTLGFSDLPRFISSGILFLIAFPVGMSAVYQLSFKQTLALKRKFTISGVYSFSRNPQYVIHVLLVAAIVLATNSSLRSNRSSKFTSTEPNWAKAREIRNMNVKRNVLLFLIPES